MRLGQLARKLDLRPVEIVEFLASHDITIEEGSNARIEDEYSTLVVRHFAPGLQETAPEEKEETEIITEPPLSSEITPTEIPIVADQIQEEKPELIKAPKVELPGLKVIGKIDMTEPKKKEPPSLTDPSSTEPQSAEKEKPLRQEGRKIAGLRTGRRDQPPRKNPIAIQRENEAVQAEKKRRSEAEREKEKRTQHYFKKVKVSNPTKQLKLMNEEVEEMEPLPELPKTRWGRFVKWLTS
jgi:hypothetical protein